MTDEAQSGPQAQAAIGPLDIRRIMAALPHRYPMLLVDRVVSILPGQSIHALNVFVVSGYFALVWMELKDLPSRLNPPAEADDAAEPKVRRTTRVNRLSKAKR